MPRSEVIELLGHSDVKLSAEVFHAEGAAKCIVMLMHGGGQTRHSWTAAAQALSREGYTAVTYDARGHGESAWSPDGDYSFEVLALDLLAVRRQLSARGPVVGIGASAITDVVKGENNQLFAADADRPSIRVFRP